MTNLANYQKIAEFVKIRGHRLQAALEARPLTDQAFALQQQMRTIGEELVDFGNGLDLAVTTFSGLVAEDNKAKVLQATIYQDHGIFPHERDKVAQFTFSTNAIAILQPFDIRAGRVDGGPERYSLELRWV